MRYMVKKVRKQACEADSDYEVVEEAEDREKAYRKWSS